MVYKNFFKKTNGFLLHIDSTSTRSQEPNHHLAKSNKSLYSQLCTSMYISSAPTHRINLLPNRNLKPKHQDVNIGTISALQLYASRSLTRQWHSYYMLNLSLQAQFSFCVQVMKLLLKLYAASLFAEGPYWCPDILLSIVYFNLRVLRLGPWQ